MRTVISVFLFFILFQTTKAQYDCSDGRYKSLNYFSGSNKTTGVQYGANTTNLGVNQNLYMDIYQPNGDVAPLRPLVIFAFGGSFVAGDRTQMESGCESFAKMGYVTATIDYRIGVVNQLYYVDYYHAAMRAMQDMRAAVRFFKKDVAENGNQYRVDTNHIVVAGVSAGAITALNVAFLNDNAELPLGVNTGVVGSIEGNSGNAGYSSKVHGVINFSGAVHDVNIMDENTIPVYSVHDIGDPVVPYESVNYAGFSFEGGKNIHNYLDSVGVANKLVSIPSNQHVSYFVGATAFQVVDTAMQFFAENLICDFAAGLESVENKPAIKVYPNPATDYLHIGFPESSIGEKAEMYDAMGKLVGILNIESSEIQINRALFNLQPGIYHLRFQNPSVYPEGATIIWK